MPSIAVSIPTKEEIPIAMMAPVNTVLRRCNLTEVRASRTFSIKFMECSFWNS
jgi:hypothetical protein